MSLLVLECVSFDNKLYQNAKIILCCISQIFSKAILDFFNILVQNNTCDRNALYYGKW